MLNHEQGMRTNPFAEGIQEIEAVLQEGVQHGTIFKGQRVRQERNEAKLTLCNNTLPVLSKLQPRIIINFKSKV